MWDDVEIVTLTQAKTHLRLSGSDEDADLTLKLRQAHALVLDHVSNARDDDYLAEMQTWDDETAPAAVQAAILRQFGDLYRFRGDDDDASESRVNGNLLSPRVLQLLQRYHDPSLA